MTTFPAANFLIEFGSETISKAALAARGGAPAADLAPRVTEDDLTAAVEEAYARGKAEGLAAGLEAVDARLKQEVARSAQELASARETWVTAEGARLAEQASRAINQIASEIAATTARILKPVLHRAVSGDAVSELAAALQDLIAREPGVELAVSGPEDLVSRLRAELQGKIESLKISTVPGADIRVTAGRSVLETRLQAWADKLDEAFI